MLLRGFGLSLSVFAFLFLNTACGQKGSNPAAVPSFPPTEPGPPELPYCSTAKTFSSPVTITGNAKYEYRAPFGTKGAGGLGAVEALPRPIRYAEVRVLDSKGDVVQCGKTDDLGDFSITLPTDSKTYTVQVNSRAKNSQLNATVFDLPDSKVFYTLSKKVTANSSKNIGILTAKGDGDLKGGAFNILDQLLVSNEYLRAKASDCATDFPGCANFTVTPKIEVFWKNGFNPGSYFDSDPLSFYLPGYGRLFILGGVNGDTDNTDTDHFDNSVIIHEFGHFLEDKVFASDSPEGSHNGNGIIDPRLAWSEGWGNFIQAAVLTAPHEVPEYIDTIGNLDGDTDFAFKVNLELQATYDVPAYGPGSSLGEGNFREFSVTRLLWDSIDDPGTDGDTITDGFPEIWASLTDSSGGFKDSSQKFRSIGLFHTIQRGLANNGGNGTDWASIRTEEKQNGDLTDYAFPVEARNGCPTVNATSYNFSITPAYASRDLFRNNDFFHYKTSAATNVRFRLQYNSSTELADLDFYIYNESAQFGDYDDIVGASDKSPTASGQQTETITLSKLAAGDYLINVLAYTGDRNGVGEVNNYRIQRSTDGGATWKNLCEKL